MMFKINGTDGCCVASLIDIEEGFVWVGLVNPGSEEWFVDKRLHDRGEMLVDSVQPDKLRRTTEPRDLLSCEEWRLEKKRYRLRYRSGWGEYVYACEVGNCADDACYHHP